MRSWLHHIEVMVDAIIPYLLIILAVVLICEIFAAAFFAPYAFAVEIYDWIVVSVFALDLFFKYLRVRNIPKFVKRYWLDIIATLPAFLILRTVEGMAALGKLLRFQEELQQPQVIVHEGLMIQRQAVRIIEESERFGEVSRFERFGKFFGRVPG